MLIKKDNGAIDEKTSTLSYRSIFKATSLFGGVQLYQIIISVVKSKFVAILLGPAGMGLQGLYQSTLDLIKSVSALGLEQSAVRDISEANGSGDLNRVSRTVETVRKLVWVTGSLGLLITLILSPLLSKLTFGNGDYTWGFIILSTTLLINQLCSGQKVLLQGMRRLKDLAKASAVGSTVGLLVSIPIYYWLGVDGIVPTMVLTSITALLLSWFYSRRIEIIKTHVTTRQAINDGRSMIKMGIAMSVSGILVTLCAYILRGFIRQQGGVDEVGLFTAGFVIVNTYVGMVFSAMGTDYYPRLAAVNKDNNKCKELINQQGEVALLILAPIIVSCILFMPLLIKIIYSDAFLPANDYIMFAVTGVFFKAVSWVISYSFLAKAESKLFVINETITNVYTLGLYLLGYSIGGLSGLGITFALGYLIYLIQVYCISRMRYGFRFTKSFINILLVQFLFVGTCLTLRLMLNSNLFYVLGGIVFGLCSGYSLFSLNRRIRLINL